MIAALLRSEFHKLASTRVWWGLLIPVVLLSVLLNLFGGVFTLAAGVGPEGESRLPLLLASLAYSLALTSTFAAVHGTIVTAGEFRHRTVTTTYLTAPGRGAVLGAKLVVSAAVGVGYALAATVSGVLAGLVGQGGAQFPEPGSLLLVVAIGAAVGGLWGALGAALGMILTNQVAVLVTLLVYTLLGELLLSSALGSSDAVPVAQLTRFLPVNAGEVALYDVPAAVIAGADSGPDLVGVLAGVTDPFPWWGALLVLLGWTAAAGAVAWWTGGRRDVT